MMDDREMVERFMQTLVLPPHLTWGEFAPMLDAVTNQSAADTTPERIETISSHGGWNLRVAVWKPRGAGPWPTILHLHGGGWVSGNHLSHRTFDAALAAAGNVVVAVDYRRAPKHRFPAALDDSFLALEWCVANNDSLGGDPARIVILGDSAGANLAAALLSHGGAAHCAAGVLLFGVYDYHSALPIIGGFSGGHEASTQAYVEPEAFEALRTDPRLNPIYARADWPPLYVASGTRDPLVEQTRRFHHHLLETGADHTYVELLGAPHSYIQLPQHPAFAAGFESITSFLELVMSGEQNNDRSDESDA